MQQWLIDNALVIALVVVAIWCTTQEIRFWIMESRHKKQVQELLDRHMSRNFGEYAMGRVAMGETKRADEKSEDAGDAINSLDELIDEEMGFTAHGTYRDQKGNEIAPVS